MAKKKSKSKKSKFPDRGFATTSIPKKVIPVKEEEDEAKKEKERIELEKKAKELEEQKEAERKKRELELKSAEQMEKEKKIREYKMKDILSETKVNNILNNLNITSNEITKIPALELSFDSEKQLLDYILKNRNERVEVKNDTQNEKDLYVNYSILLKLGFKENHVQEAFLKSDSFKLESLLEWLYISLKPEDIPLSIRGIIV